MSRPHWVCLLSNGQEYAGCNDDHPRPWGQLQGYLHENGLKIIGTRLIAFGRTHQAPAHMERYFVPTRVSEALFPVRGNRKVEHGLGYLHGGFRHMLWVSDGESRLEITPWRD
ncbi:MAG: hypothetical protein PHI12_10395 [Dehalococcoidales bacterium]|nr:hypothetical protein [Dehalococcoidales bacterium]